MSRQLFAILLLSFALAVPRATGESPESADAALYPETTIYYAELTDPPALVSLIFDHPLREKIEQLPQYQMATQTPDYKRFLFGRAMVETQLQMSWREALDTLLAKKVSVAFDAETRSAVAIVRGKDEASMKLFAEKMVAFAELGENADEIRQTEYRGLQAYKIQDVLYAISDDRMVITNKPELGRTVIDCLLDGGPSLNDNERFQSAWKTRKEGELAWSFVDVEAVRQYASDPFETQINNPVLELLVGGIQSALANSPYATSSLSGDQKSLTLNLMTPFEADWIPESRDYFFGPAANGRGAAVPEIDDTLFSLSTYRDFSELWLRAGDLFNADINDGFAQADANLSTLFAGRDFGEDILGSFQSEVVVVATRQDFSETLPRPTLRLPAFAAVFKLKEPEEMTRELRRIFQSLVGFLNVIGAMNGQNQLEMDMDKIGDHAELVTTQFVPESDEEESTEAGVIFNFSPSVGFSGERFVVASTAELARLLVEAKSSEAASLVDNTRGSLNARVLQQVLADNREQLIAQNMLEDGNSREEAEAVIELVLQVMGYFDGMTMRLTPAEDMLEASFQVQVAP
ncbi:MAG: hypothetical protein AAGG48_09010 [Planctomycetota bacterium]